MFSRKTPEDFYDYLRYKRNLRKVTVSNYKCILGKVLRDLGTLKPKARLVEEYALQIRKKECSASHFNNTAVILENYLLFIGIKVNLGRIKKPKPIIKDTFTEGEVARMLAACKNSREEAVIAVLAYSGVRNGELCRLRVEDIDLDNGVVKVFDGKGGKDGVSYISRECVQIVGRYLSEYPRKKEDYLITTLVRGNQYASWDLRKLVRVVARRAKIEKRAYPHLFRHSLATNLIRSGCSIITVQNQLRHEKLDTTLIYVRSFPQRIQTEYNYHVPSYV